MTEHKKLKEIVNLDKIELVWNSYFNERTQGKCSNDNWNLTELEKIILEACAQDFKDRIEY